MTVFSPPLNQHNRRFADEELRFQVEHEFYGLLVLNLFHKLAPGMVFSRFTLEHKSEKKML